MISCPFPATCVHFATFQQALSGIQQCGGRVCVHVLQQHTTAGALRSQFPGCGTSPVMTWSTSAATSGFSLRSSRDSICCGDGHGATAAPPALPALILPFPTDLAFVLTAAGARPNSRMPRQRRIHDLLLRPRRRQCGGIASGDVH